MGQLYSEISDKLKQFIENQKLFFVGTATADSRVTFLRKEWTPCEFSIKTELYG